MSVDSPSYGELMLEKLVNVLSYSIFWNSRSRGRVRDKVRWWIPIIKQFVFSTVLIPLPKSEGERLVEYRVLLFGIPVFARRWQRQKYRVALLVDEFFGGWDTAIGGYGALARKYVCKYIPDPEIQIDLLMDAYGGRAVQKKLVDQTMIYRLPGHPVSRQRWFDRQGYNLFLSIEMTEISYKILSTLDTNTPLLYWIQDPRELKMYQSRLQTVNRLRDSDWSYLADVTLWIQQMVSRKRVSFISQGESLSQIAREMYQIPEAVPMEDLPNPIDIDFNYILNDPPRENKIIFLGRLEAQKRVWIVCEIAKAMPQYEFYILGATGKGRDEAANAMALEPYRNPDGSSKIANLHFTGHVDGEEKNRHIKTARLVLNTSIWEGIPVSWLETLSYGTLIVSAFDRDNIVERFGTFVGEVMGDGTDTEAIKRFTTAVDYWMSHDGERDAVAQKAIDFVRDRHSVAAFVTNMRRAIHKEIP